MEPPPNPMIQERTLPSGRADEVADQGRHDSGSSTPGCPEQPHAKTQPPAEPEVYRHHQGHHREGLGDGQHDPERDEEMPGLCDEPSRSMLTR